MSALAKNVLRVVSMGALMYLYALGATTRQHIEHIVPLPPPLPPPPRPLCTIIIVVGCACACWGCDLLLSVTPLYSIWGMGNRVGPSVLAVFDPFPVFGYFFGFWGR